MVIRRQIENSFTREIFNRRVIEEEHCEEAKKESNHCPLAQVKVDCDQNYTSLVTFICCFFPRHRVDREIFGHHQMRLTKEVERKQMH